MALTAAMQRNKNWVVRRSPYGRPAHPAQPWRARLCCQRPLQHKNYLNAQSRKCSGDNNLARVHTHGRASFEGTFFAKAQNVFSNKSNVWKNSFSCVSVIGSVILTKFSHQLGGSRAGILVFSFRRHLTVMQSLLSITTHQGRGSIPMASCLLQTASDRKLYQNIAVNQLYFFFPVIYTHMALNFKKNNLKNPTRRAQWSARCSVIKSFIISGMMQQASLCGVMLFRFINSLHLRCGTLLFALGSNNKGFSSVTMKDLLQLYYTLLGTASSNAAVLMPNIGF